MQVLSPRHCQDPCLQPWPDARLVRTEVTRIRVIEADMVWWWVQFQSHTALTLTLIIDQSQQRTLNCRQSTISTMFCFVLIIMSDHGTTLSSLCCLCWEAGSRISFYLTMAPSCYAGENVQLKITSKEGGDLNWLSVASLNIVSISTFSGTLLTLQIFKHVNKT